MGDFLDHTLAQSSAVSGRRLLLMVDAWLDDDILQRVGLMDCFPFNLIVCHVLLACARVARLRIESKLPIFMLDDPVSNLLCPIRRFLEYTS